MRGFKTKDLTILGLGAVGLIATAAFSYRILSKLDSGNNRNSG